MATEVHNQLVSMQTGEYTPTEEEKQALEASAQAPDSPVRRMPSQTVLNQMRVDPYEAMRFEDVGREAAAAGYGRSRYDVGEFVPDSDLENKRALEQNNFWKVANGAIKGGIFAGTTAVETVAGVIDGLLEGTAEAVRQAADKERFDLGKIVGAGVNNFTARTMHDIQTLSDEWFPNYRTTEERSDEYQRNWQKHIFSANFIGDSFLKNFGFTVGAMAGGMVWSKALSGAFRTATANQLMKGVTAAAEGNAEAKEALSKSLDLISKYAASTVDEETIRKNIVGAAKTLNRMTAKQQMFGGLIGAMGEGTMEGVMARDEFLDSYLSGLDREYVDKKNSLAETLAIENRGTNLVTEVPYRDTDGQIKTRPVLNSNGMRLLREKQDELLSDYHKQREYALERADKIAATTFGLNIPILTISNTIQFGKLFSGGWKTTRSNLSRVAGGLTTDANKVVANYSGINNTVANAIGRASKVGASEAAEEMLQGFASSGAKKVAEEKISSFNDAGYDRDAMKLYASGAKIFLEGGGEYLSDWKNWQEGFMGMITGLIAMPGRGYFSGQRGGLAEAIAESRAETKASFEAAKVLNDTVNSERFQKAWNGYVRHMKYETDMQNAAIADDQYAWKTANDQQLINDIMMFADADRLNDLKEIVDMYASMDDSQLEDSGAIEAATSPGNESEAKNNPSKIGSNIREQAQNVKDTIDMYNSMYNALSARAPIGTTPEQLRELIATSMGIRNFEKRFLSLFGEVIETLDKKGYAKPLFAVDKNGEEISDDEKQRARAREVYSSLAEIYTGTELPVDTPVIDLLDKMATAQEIEEKIKESGDKELAKKFEDMKKISDDRKNFLKKLMLLQKMSPEKFEAEAESPEKVAAEIQEQAAQAETQEFKSVSDVRKAWSGRKANERGDFMRMLKSMKNPTEPVSEFIKLHDRDESFQAFIQNKFKTDGVNVDDNIADYNMINYVLKSLVYNAANESDYIGMLDSVFPTYEEFARDNSTIFGVAPQESTLAAIKKAIRGVMKEYLAAEEATKSGNTISPTTVDPAPNPATVSTPQGYDPAQPGSVVPLPQELPDRLQEESPEDVPVSEQVITEEPQGGTETSSSENGAEQKQETPVEKQPESPASEEQPKTSVDQSTEEVAVSTSSSPSAEEFFRDFSDAAKEDKSATDAEDDRVIVGKKEMIPYYRTSVPEVATGEASSARFALGKDMDMYKQADLSDFLEYLQHQVDRAQEDFKNADRGSKKEAEEKLKKAKANLSGWEKTWNALKDKEAFDNVAEVVKVGDEIEFVIDPNFPDFNGQPQILMTVMKNGERKVLSLLSTQTRMYLGLAELRQDIQNEYLAWKEQHPGELFVFSKKTKVWKKRKGLIDFDPTKYNDKPIKNTPGYKEDAPIVYINSDGVATLVRGNDKSVLGRVSETFNDPERNRDGNSDKRGNLYYLTDSGDGWMIPIRLGVEHFNKTTAEALSNPTFDEIISRIKNIADIVRNTTSENHSEQHAKMIGEVKKLSEVLDIHDVEFHIGDFNNVGPAIRLFSTTNDMVPDKMRRADQITDEWLLDYFMGLARPVQIKEKKSGAEKSIDPKTISEYIEQGLITSNARKMRAKGVDFYTNPYIGGEFKPATSIQVQEEENLRREEEQSRAENTEKVNVPESEPVAQTEDDPFADFGAFSGEDMFDTGAVETTQAESEASDAATNDEKNQEEIRKEQAGTIRKTVLAGREDDMRNITPYELAKIIVTVIYNGEAAVNAIADAAVVLSSTYTSSANAVIHAKNIFNVLFTPEEKQAISAELSKRFGWSNPADISALALFEDVADESEITSINGEDVNVVKDAYRRMTQVLDNLRVIRDALAQSVQIVGKITTPSVDAIDICGNKWDVRFFQNLSERMQNALIEKGYSPEEYNNMSEELQDQILSCISF
ncbi:MAG: hypothetical protein IJ821_07365 [Lachnospiraceae bacterium]|nr:hypothetical protein [Lachnospiraceae bacterium]